MKKVLKGFALVVGSFIGFALLIGLIVGPSDSSTSSDYSSTTATTETRKPDGASAYIPAKMFAERHLGSADYGWGNDGFVDYGDGSYHVTGIADVPGKRIRWTVELKYKGGEPTDPNNYSEAGFVSN